MVVKFDHWHPETEEDCEIEAEVSKDEPENNYFGDIEWVTINGEAVEPDELPESHRMAIWEKVEEKAELESCPPEE